MTSTCDDLMDRS